MSLLTVICHFLYIYLVYLYVFFKIIIVLFIIITNSGTIYHVALHDFFRSVLTNRLFAKVLLNRVCPDKPAAVRSSEL